MKCVPESLTLFPYFFYVLWKFFILIFLGTLKLEIDVKIVNTKNHITERLIRNETDNTMYKNKVKS